jgi:hypothetical protein
LEKVNPNWGGQKKMAKLVNYQSPSLIQKSNNSGGGISYAVIKSINSAKIFDKLEVIKRSLESIVTYFDDAVVKDLDLPCPISVVYNRLMPKTLRIKAFMGNSNIGPRQIDSEYRAKDGQLYDYIRVVYAISKKTIIKNIAIVDEILDLKLLPSIWDESNVEAMKCNSEKEAKKIFKNHFVSSFKGKKVLKKYIDIICELFRIDELFIKKENKFDDVPIFTILPLIDLDKIINYLKERDIIFDKSEYLSHEFFNMNLNSVNAIVEIFPYMIAASERDENITLDELASNGDYNIGELKAEIKNGTFSSEVIGIIDSQVKFDDEMQNAIVLKSENLLLPYHSRDEYHGTAVASVASFNHLLNEDEIKVIFKVKTFEVLPRSTIKASWVMNKIEKIISENYREIKIWNVSLGCFKNGNKLSFFGKMVDRLQTKYDVLIILPSGNFGDNSVTSPSDAISAITVGSTYSSNDGVIKYTRNSGKSKIFGFYDKPNVTTIWNAPSEEDWDKNWKYVFADDKICTDSGTSFSVPIISRKAAFLRQRFNFSNEAIRALFNYQSVINNHKNVSVDFLTNLPDEDILLKIDGMLPPKAKKYDQVVLPYFENEKLGIDLRFAISISVAHTIESVSEIGDEYTASDISFKLYSVWKGEGDKVYRTSIIKNNPKKMEDGLNADERTLRAYFGKYNPNTVLVDEDFVLKTKKTVKNKKYNFSHFEFAIERVDLLDNSKEEIKYSAIVHLKETEKGSLNDFFSLNVNRLESEPIDLKETLISKSDIELDV